jgi:type I restriction enzyme S subunit
MMAKPMTELDRLITELCPDGVPYKTLGEIATEIYRGSGIKREEITEDGEPCVRYGEIYTTYGIWFDKCVSHTKNGIKPFEHGDILFAITGENVEEIAKTCAYTGNERCFAGGDIVVMKHEQDPKYLAYALSTTDAQTQKGKGRVKSKVVHSSIPALQAIRIPIPPLPIQRAIVRILDTFTRLTAELEVELEAELEARKKQYDYYRNFLLTFDENHEHNLTDRRRRIAWTTLGKIAEFRYGFTDTAKDCGTARFIRITDIGENGELQTTDCKYVDITADNESYLLQQGDLLMARTGATYGKTMMFEENTTAVFASFLIRIRFQEGTVLPAYYWHFAQSDLYWYQADRLVSRAGQPQFNGNALKNVIIPVPSIEEQKQIIATLNRFNVLSNDLSASLPAEIEARRKQYEYYRDKLLTFKGKTA